MPHLSEHSSKGTKVICGKAEVAATKKGSRLATFKAERQKVVSYDLKKPHIWGGHSFKGRTKSPERRGPRPVRR